MPFEFVEFTRGLNGEKNNGRELFRIDSLMSRHGFSHELAEKTFEFEEMTLDSFISVWFHSPTPSPNRAKRTLNFGYEWKRRCLCGEGNLTASATEWLQLTSPDYPNNYCNELKCEYRIVAPEGHRVLLNVTDFNTEAELDYLTVFNGNSTTGKHIDMISGPKISFSDPLHSESTQMTLLFITDSSVQDSGFLLQFKAEMTEEYRKLLESANEFSPKAFLFMFLFIITGIGVIAFFVRRANSVGLEEGGWAARFIRFPQTGSQFSLVNPLFNSNPR